MIWVAAADKDTDNAALEKRLRSAADQCRADSGLSFLRFAAQRAKLKAGHAAPASNHSPFNA